MLKSKPKVYQYDLTRLSRSQLAAMARDAINEDWTPCNENTEGIECKGYKCHVGAHKALAILEYIK